ncbi:MAG: transglutaminase family protein [Rhodospirillaceae bacterium]|jgi:transglutaminase-like putative cysteine protease|nr:transglutaminase family protein [Rhodospirillaceae bacterium]MBT4490794.1 transglutaminase family protein [Rhodospirillaceae bacterium]MBT5195053.1 transglutaminase family protein [Rhodospirillaceae bacterium]MBT5894958.1 transglutaminase family protein [Rhodospirillaceae bacterium]MBT6428746.1 transglutaminase family protein [Rhodospirillaceae bacterium]
MSEDPSEFLKPGAMVESADPDIMAFAAEAASDAVTAKEKAIKLYYEVRDGIRYDPYASSLDVDGMKASKTLADMKGYCVQKAVLLAAVCRAQGIPARLGFADVRNHLSTGKMRERMKTDTFYWHGYTAIYLDDQWFKSTPAFNVELCEKFGLKALEFDGEADSIYHEFDTSGNRHMEYLNFCGEFAEPPLDKMLETYMAHYDHWKTGKRTMTGDFDAEVAAETSAKTGGA